jgi:hypothetical protein
MTQVFLNHKSEEKSIAIAVKKYLNRCLISVWIDSDEMHGGSMLSSSILEGINTSRYFLAFISPRYVRSDWCMRELEEAESSAIRGKVIIIPVLLTPKDELRLNELSSRSATLLNSILSRYVFINYDKYDPDLSARNISNAIAQQQLIQFEPVQLTNIDGIDVQLIQFDLINGLLPTNLFQKWTLNFEHDFLSYKDGEEKPLRAGKPVALNGKGPAWLYSYLTVGFKNLCPVYIFNNPSEEYICVYDTGTPPLNEGKVLRV